MSNNIKLVDKNNHFVCKLWENYIFSMKVTQKINIIRKLPNVFPIERGSNPLVMSNVIRAENRISIQMEEM